MCGDDLSETPQYYELGHKVDRVCGGSDTDDNLCVQCVSCNRLKPLHDNPEDYEAWVKNGGILGDFVRSLEGSKE